MRAADRDQQHNQKRRHTMEPNRAMAEASTEHATAHGHFRWAESPIARVQRSLSTLARYSAIPFGANATPTNANRAIRIAT